MNVLCRPLTKRYAKRCGVSVSAMVEAYLVSLDESKDMSPEDSPPIFAIRPRHSQESGSWRVQKTHHCQAPMKSSWTGSPASAQALLYGRPSKQVQRRGCWLLTRLRRSTI